MKVSVLVPLLDEAKNLPALLRFLKAATRRARDFEILFLDNGSSDGTPDLLAAAQLPGARLLREPKRGFAEPLNLGLREAKGEIFLFLDADALPDAGWIPAMEKAFANADIVVGETLSGTPTRRTPYALVAAKLFDGHSARTAHAQGHALPWGPTCNLGVRRAWVEKVGPFSGEAGGAFDIDWCWRAVLQGARITYGKHAKVRHARRAERRSLLEQFERYGIGEAWLHRTYAFLLASEDQSADPVLAGVDAFRRLRYLSEAAKTKSMQGPLEEVAAAFAAGVRLGYDRPYRECPLPRPAPRTALSWANGPKSTTVFVPGKGLATLEGKQKQLWEAVQAGVEEAELARLFQRLFKANEEEARYGIQEFKASLAV